MRLRILGFRLGTMEIVCLAIAGLWIFGVWTPPTMSTGIGSLNATDSNVTTSETAIAMVKIQTGILNQIANFAPVIGICLAAMIIISIICWAMPFNSSRELEPNLTGASATVMHSMIQHPPVEVQEPTEREMFDSVVKQQQAEIEQPQVRRRKVVHKTTERRNISQKSDIK